MNFSEYTPGRSFILKLSPGEILHEQIEKFAAELVEEMAAPAADVVVPQAEVPAAEAEATPAN